MDINIVSNVVPEQGAVWPLQPAVDDTYITERQVAGEGRPQFTNVYCERRGAGKGCVAFTAHIYI
jgi:hypothetical protein